MRDDARILAAGERAVLVEFDCAAEVERFTTQVRAVRPPEIRDVVATERAVMVFASSDTSSTELRAIVATHLGREQVPQADDQPAHDRMMTIGVRYDGADLDDLARATGLGRAGIIGLHTSSTWLCSFIGFAPGFGYLTSADHHLDIPRRPQSRPHVPAGSVALAGRYSAVYPRSSPGGWQLIGTTDTPLWDIDAEPPSRLAAGVRVRFVDLDAG